MISHVPTKLLQSLSRSIVVQAGLEDGGNEIQAFCLYNVITSFAYIIMQLSSIYPIVGNFYAGHNLTGVLLWDCVRAVGSHIDPFAVAVMKSRSNTVGHVTCGLQLLVSL